MTRNEIARHVQGNTGVLTELVKGEGYWYFTATWTNREGKVELYETESVYVMRLGDMPAARWIEEGRRFIAGVVATLKERGLYQ